MTENVQVLFVAWQDPTHRRFWPIARLVSLPPGDRRFEFCYIRGVNRAQEQGFRPFLAFPELHQVYRSRELFPLFANRLMSPSRMDYPQYIERLGLEPENSMPLEVLARSGGARTTDSIELFPLPVFHEEFHRYRTYFLAHAIRYLPAASHERILQLETNEKLLLMGDCQNPVDPQAIALRTEDRVIVGYVPGYLLQDAWALVENCGRLEIRVSRVNPPPAPLQHRLLCRLDACWPDDFQPFFESRYEPISDEAAPLPAPTAVAY